MEATPLGIRLPNQVQEKKRQQLGGFHIQNVHRKRNLRCDLWDITCFMAELIDATKAHGEDFERIEYILALEERADHV